MNYYRVDSTKLSFREIWCCKPGLPFLVPALKKILGVKLMSSNILGRPDALAVTEPAELRDQNRTALEPVVEQAKGLGFEWRFFYTIPVIGDDTTAAAALINKDRITILTVAHSEPIKVLQKFRPNFSFVSRHSDGHFLATIGGLPSLLGSAPEIQAVRVRNGSLEQTWDRHSARTSEAIDGLIPFRVEELANTVLRIIQRKFDYNLDRGVLIPCDE